jgi:hypothetical protein
MSGLFEEWVDLNQVICAYRSRFDVMREDLPKCRTREEAERLLKQEEYDVRYPLLPESLK